MRGAQARPAPPAWMGRGLTGYSGRMDGMRARPEAVEPASPWRVEARAMLALAWPLVERARALLRAPRPPETIAP